MCIIYYRKNGIANPLSQKRPLASRYTISEEITTFVLSSTEEHCVNLESLFSKHTKYLLKTCQQIIQPRRFKKASITLKRVLKNVTKCFDSDPHFSLTKYTNNYQEHSNIGTDKDGCKLINQRVKTTNNRYYNTHQKSILLNTVTESDIYNNYSYTSCVNWEIEKISETPSKKLEFNIKKPETSLKKTDFNIITNNDEINDMSNNKMDYHCNNSTNNRCQFLTKFKLQSRRPL